MHHKNNLHQKLSEYKNDLLSTLKVACELGEIDIWEDRSKKPNLCFSHFKLVIKILNKKDIKKTTWSDRISTKGKYGRSGEDECFKLEVMRIILGEEKSYFIKGYFFEKGNLKGVCIQSFREIPLKKLYRTGVKNELLTRKI